MHASGPRAVMSQEPDYASPRASNNNDLPEQHSAHVRSRSTAHAQSPKRLSVFSGRSRSNTTNSTTSSRRSPASSMTSADTASIPSQEDRTASVPVGPAVRERQESMTKSLFNRGSRILRRQGSKFNIAATVDEEDEMEREKSRFEVTDLFSRHHRSRQSDAQENLKNLISDPFDFHHLTHTSPSHFQELERARENDLVTEFSAIRASQRPVTGLKGIRAEDLHFRDFSSEDLAGTATTDGNRSDTIPASPPASPGAASSAASPKDVRPPRESRVYENFSRPVPRLSKVGSTTPPPRTTSPRLAASPEIPEPAPRAIDEILGLSSPPTYPDNVYSHDDDLQSSSYISTINLESMFPTPLDQHIPASGDKDMANTARTSSMSFTNMSSDLDDVPEEEESTHWNDSPAFLAEDSTMRFQPQSNPPLAEEQSASIARPKSRLSISVAEELSKKFSEALGSPTLPQYRLGPVSSRNGQGAGDMIQRRASVRRKDTYEPIHESWEDDIDYCYEHAAESNSNFDWTRNSVDEQQGYEPGISITTSDLDSPLNEVPEPRLLPSVHLSASTLPTPDLDPSPSRSLASSRVAMTPSTAGYEGQRNSDYFQPVSSSLFPSAFGKHLNQDTLYDEYLAGDAESDKHFSFCSSGMIQSMENPISPRSSFSPISKCNSQESLILSRAASIARKHRSSLSTTSVPELVHSLASSRELPIVDQGPSNEPSMPSGPPSTSVLGRPDSSSNHRHTKSLARDIETQVLYRADNQDMESERMEPPMSSSIYSRAKSTSEVEAAPLIARAKADALKSAHRRKGRTSYSLFPTPAAAN